MLNLVRVFSIAAAALVGLANFAKAEDQLMAGVKSFICDDKPIVLLKSDADWVFTEEPELQVHETRDGWRMGDQGLGFIIYLRERGGAWVAEHLSESGFEELECIDVTESTAKVITAIKPRLDENISEVQQQLATAKQELASAKQELASAREASDNLKTEYDASTREHSIALSEVSARHLGKVRTLNARHASEIQNLRDRHAYKLKSVEVTLGKVEQDFDTLRKRYSFLLQDGAGILLELQAIAALKQPERYDIVMKTTLGRIGLSNNNAVSYCVSVLRDSARLSDRCKEELVDFILKKGL